MENNTETLEIDCDSYEKAETYTQAEVNGVVSGAIDALNITQYRTDSQVSQAISDALVPYYTSTEVDSAIASNSVDLSDYYTRSQSDSRYFLQNASNVSLVRDNVTPPQVRGLVPRSPLGSNVLFSGTVLELTCDAYQIGSRRSLRPVQQPCKLGQPLFPSERQQRQHFPRGHHHAHAPNDPRACRALILGNAGTLELNCDCYNKSESDGRYYTRGQADAAFAPFSTETGLQNLNLQVIDIDSRVTTLEGSPLPADISVNSVSATGDWLTLVEGSGTRIQDHANNTLFSMTTAEAFFGVRSRVDWRLTIDTPSASDEGLYTAAVRARVGNALLTLTDARAAGLRAEGALEITGVATPHPHQRGDRAASALPQHQRLHAHLHRSHWAGGLGPI